MDDGAPSNGDYDKIIASETHVDNKI